VLLVLVDTSPSFSQHRLAEIDDITKRHAEFRVQANRNAMLFKDFDQKFLGCLVVLVKVKDILQNLGDAFIGIIL
jgi:hypothetical protein